ncbi:MAG: ACT domain-containing protein [Candidatus Competibacterales bacterium]|nr:ACT domain-containing protein [Candidatus Competibacterales bacterium]
MAVLVLTVIGNDRPGLVDTLSATIAEHGGNWEESRMAHLASKFAGILCISVAEARAQALARALEALAEDGLQVTAEQGGEATATPRHTLHLELVGQDRPGIVHDIAHALAVHGVSIEELSTETRSASMGGGQLFEARATLAVPPDVALDDLRTGLEALADELMVDLHLEQELL